MTFILAFQVRYNPSRASNLSSLFPSSVGKYFSRHFIASGILSVVGKTASEIKALEKIIELEPNHLEAKHQLALILESQGNKEEALKLYKEIASVDREFKNVQKNIEMLTSNNE